VSADCWCRVYALCLRVLLVVKCERRGVASALVGREPRRSSLLCSLFRPTIDTHTTPVTLPPLCCVKRCSASIGARNCAFRALSTRAIEPAARATASRVDTLRRLSAKHHIHNTIDRLFVKHRRSTRVAARSASRADATLPLIGACRRDVCGVSRARSLDKQSATPLYRTPFARTVARRCVLVAVVGVLSSNGVQCASLACQCCCSSPSLFARFIVPSTADTAVAPTVTILFSPTQPISLLTTLLFEIIDYLASSVLAATNWKISYYTTPIATRSASLRHCSVHTRVARHISLVASRTQCCIIIGNIIA
jgi:hypothetical protein